MSCGHDEVKEGETSIPIELDFPSKIAKVFKQKQHYDVGTYGDSLSYGIERFKSLNVNVNLYGHTEKIDDVVLRDCYMKLEEEVKMVKRMSHSKRYERCRDSIFSCKDVKWLKLVNRTNTHIVKTYLTNVDEKSFLKVKFSFKKQIKRKLVNHIQRFLEEISRLAYTASDYQRNLIYYCDFCRTRRPEFLKLKRCSRCKKVYYCSKDCQKFGWKEHKKFCKVD